MTNLQQMSPTPTSPLPLLPSLILGSSSTYRKELLARLQIPFDVIAPDIDETPEAGESPEATALRLAREKARADALVIGSDQVAMLDGEQIGKPGNHKNALQQLHRMRGRRVIFHTALCLWDGSQKQPEAAAQIENIQTLVTFRDLPDAEPEAYLYIEQPYDCAGSAKTKAWASPSWKKSRAPIPLR